MATAAQLGITSGVMSRVPMWSSGAAVGRSRVTALEMWALRLVLLVTVVGVLGGSECGFGFHCSPFDVVIVNDVVLAALRQEK